MLFGNVKGLKAVWSKKEKMISYIKPNKIDKIPDESKEIFIRNENLYFPLFLLDTYGDNIRFTGIVTYEYGIECIDEYFRNYIITDFLDEIIISYDWRKDIIKYSEPPSFLGRCVSVTGMFLYTASLEKEKIEEAKNYLKKGLVTDTVFVADSIRILN